MTVSQSDATNRQTPPPGPPAQVRFLVFAASLRAGSLNDRLARLACRAIEAHGGTADLAAMSDLDCPSYDQDVEAGDGFPPGAEECRRRIEANDAFVIASPEYNGSLPGLLKNTIDWVSRYRPQPESIPKLVETRVTSGRSGCGMSLAIGMDDPEFLLNRGTERREVAIAE